MSRTNRLAARRYRCHVESCRRADRAAHLAGSAVERIWRGVLLAIQHRDCHTAHLLLHGLAGQARTAIARTLSAHARWTHARVRADILGEIPERKSLRESLSWDDLLAPLRSDDEPGEPDWSALLFPAPSEERVSQVVFGSGWQQRLRSGTGLGDPGNMAARITTGLVLGKTHQEIARDLLPEVQRVQATARRIARTESLRVATAIQMDAHRQLGDMVIGYQVRATLDQNTRPWHRERDGTVYYLDPGPGQKGMAQCPHPPDEAADPTERPADAPATAWNCRCWLSPVLRD